MQHDKEFKEFISKFEVPDTLEGLDKLLEENGFNRSNCLVIGSPYSNEGYIARKKDDKFVFEYTERGSLSVLKSFDTEKELVNHVFEKLCMKEWNWLVCVGFDKDLDNILRAQAELDSYGILYERDDVRNFYAGGKTAYRLYIFGKDYDKLKGTDFHNKYYNPR